MTNRKEVKVKDTKLVIICATILGVFMIGALIMLSHVPDGGEAATRSVGLLVASLAPTIGSIILAVRQSNVNGKIDQTQTNTERMLNGVMDTKIQENVHKVMSERDAQEK